jgi:hypothetical protein
MSSVYQSFKLLSTKRISYNPSEKQTGVKSLMNNKPIFILIWTDSFTPGQQIAAHAQHGLSTSSPAGNWPRRNTSIRMGEESTLWEQSLDEDTASQVFIRALTVSGQGPANQPASVVCHVRAMPG